jgi:hypothetical protein
MPNDEKPYDPIAVANEKINQGSTGDSARVTPRNIHDYMRARELARGITAELSGLPPAPWSGDEGATRELYEYTQELYSILGRYYPNVYYGDDDD